ncbi:MAG: RNA polymerase sigma factor [Phycisphaerales bacterium]
MKNDTLKMSDTNDSTMHLFVQNLPDVDRRVLMLHYAEELPAADIAAILGLSVVQVETRLTALRTCAKAVMGGTRLNRAG